MQADIRGLDVSLKKSADSHLGNMLNTIGLLLNLVQADIVLSIACVAEFGHFECVE